NIAVRETELKRSVTQVFYAILLLQEKKKLLIRADSNYAEFLRKASLRLEKGEANILEKTTAETQRGNIYLQLKALQEEMELLQIQLRLLLNTTELLEPQATSLKVPAPPGMDSSNLSGHPLLTILQQQKIAATANTELEKARLLPDLNIGYSNASIRGVGADNIVYGSGTRFSSAMIGIGIPIFASSQKAKISSSRAYERIAETNYQVQLQTLESQYRTAVTQYMAGLQSVAYFEKTALPNAGLITQTANKQFLNGEINYLEWVMLNNQSIMIENSYLDALKALNESLIHITYLLSK
ncbi:MAG: TolC family protein, partial [Chitinophagaceae bacterium]|nr:TolC family protein [Chitinophagaceae bacterium]